MQPFDRTTPTARPTPPGQNPKLTGFSMRRPRHGTTQEESLLWLAQVHAAAEATKNGLDAPATKAFFERIQRVINHCACGPDKIAQRGHVLADVGHTAWTEMAIYDVSADPRGRGTDARTRLFDKLVTAYFESEYQEETAAPGDVIHVTCTGYVSPSGAQKMVAKKGWGSQTRVTHAYQMGCYAAFPALRMAAGALALAPSLAADASNVGRVDIVHTELCSLHLDPSNHGIEQLVVQSLFADGFIRYSMIQGDVDSGLEVLALSELVIPDSAESMAWTVSDAGMHMTLSADVPKRVAASLRGFVAALYEKAGMKSAEQQGKTVFAVHPGGPKIIDGVCQVLELADRQVQTSRDVLRDYGNMSSATVPHVWMRIVDDPGIPKGTLVLSLAFGPGLTVCGGLFRKV